MNNNVRWVRLGDYIQRSMVNNKNLQYSADLIEGVNSNGEFCPPKANTVGINLKPYKIVQDGDFVYNPSRLNIGSLAFRTDGLCIVSHLYVVFHLNELGREKLLPEFLLLYFKRDEFLRLIDYLNFGSQRPEFNFFDMSEIKIPLPDIETQQELVDSYSGLKTLAEQNEALIAPLTEACQAYIVECKKKYPEVELGNYIEEIVLRIGDNTSIDISGINLEQGFIPTVANMNGIDKSKYKLVPVYSFACNLMHIGRDVKIPIAFNDNNKSIAVSPAYYIFKIKESEKRKILDFYLKIILTRDEFGRLAWFHTDSSIRGNLLTSEFRNIRIPLPPSDVQQAIVNLYTCAEDAKKIAKTAREKMKILCPALMQKAING
ncbi:putative Type I site-specific deoxyribonuclease [Vibrio chagasii]|nr:putative Type I site-specific deoxyribonuclease [Vibrio chagasii]CAH6905483.1 putative Type I site-specific deoxyribonuclease [Vibrio chagasii]